MNQMNMMNPKNNMNMMNPMNMNPMNNMNMMNPMNPMNNMNPMNPMNMNQMNMNQMNMMNPMNMNQMNNMNMDQMIMDQMNMLNMMNNMKPMFVYPNPMDNQSNNLNNTIKNKDTEELKINLHPNLKPRGEHHFKPLLQNFKERFIKLYRCSMDLSKKMEMTEHPVLTSYYYADLDHYPIVLSPDILWMLILEGFSYHVRLNHMRLREKFVKNNQNKNKIIVSQGANVDSHINDVTSQRWGDIFKGFIEQSKEKIDGTVLHLFTPYFSTTTTDIEYASQIAIISIVSPFVKFIKRFEPEYVCVGCGFPYINLQGTLQDYKQLKMKIEGLKGYLIDDWIYKLIPIIDKIIETKKGNIDKQFWDNIITNKKTVYKELVPLLPSSERHKVVEKEKIEIFGWIFDFFPFKIKNEGIKSLDNDEEIKIYKSYHIKFESLLRNDIKIYENSDFSDLPEEMINIDATYKNKSGQIVELGIKTGFLGYTLNQKKEFQPEIGWYFYVKDDPHNLIKTI